MWGINAFSLLLYVYDAVLVLICIHYNIQSNKIVNIRRNIYKKIVPTIYREHKPYLQKYYFLFNVLRVRLISAFSVKENMKVNVQNSKKLKLAFVRIYPHWLV